MAFNKQHFRNIHILAHKMMADSPLSLLVRLQGTNGSKARQAVSANQSGNFRKANSYLYILIAIEAPNPKTL